MGENLLEIKMIQYYKDTKQGRKWYQGYLDNPSEGSFDSRDEKRILADGWIKIDTSKPALYAGDDPFFEPPIYERLRIAYPQLIKFIKRVNSGVVYHYTTWETLMNGILSKDNLSNRMAILRAFSVHYMNDDKEGTVLGNQIINDLKALSDNSFERLPMTDYKINFLKTVVRQYRKFWFSTSLSYEKDSLPMWSNYGSSGKGIAVGISAEEIWNQGFELYECIYDLDILNAVADAFAKRRPIDTGVFDVLIKDPHFAYERECRIPMHQFWGHCVKTRRDQFLEYEFGLKNGCIAPFVSVRLPLNAIKSIIIGPTNNPERARDALSWWLRSINVNARIEWSTAPLSM